ncbi:MAG: hypothetical protein MZV70_25070 [Desulfobacterales bacterium]|nr:hypothetical protein [Desulfobacterales bacterium]
MMGGFHLSGPFFEPIIDRTTQELQKLEPGLCDSDALHGTESDYGNGKTDAAAIYFEYGGNKTDIS